MNYSVNEIFPSIQGEGAYTGTPSVFVRLQGCDVGCPWCDTKHTWDVEPSDIIPSANMIAKTGDAHGYAVMDQFELFETIRAYRITHIVITGGEPLQHDLNPLIRLLLEAGNTVQLETSGTRPLDVPAGTYITVSPKIGMPGAADFDPLTLQGASEIKMPIGRDRDLEALLAVLYASPVAEPLVYLQPLSQSPKATDLCVQAAMEHGFKVSIQIHKYLKVR